ncbi:hypothetical protein FACS1894130_08770 [Spirochaetia bacterium]|nr:hypothetical protein FACS1894130_08770 [Spirochaetia bacterium]
MTRISVHGNRKDRGKTQGFVLLDALLCLFITGFMLLMLQGTAAVQRRIAVETAAHTQKIIEERNHIAAEIIGSIYEKQ